jgi:HSP20 family protein
MVLRSFTWARTKISNSPKEITFMSIVRYDPFRELRNLQEEMNRIFSNNLTRGFSDEGMARGTWLPNVDIFETQDSLVLEAELPGMNRDDFELTIENNVLTLRGERRFEKQSDDDLTHHRVERAYGAFSRSFTLPPTISSEDAMAEYKNGVLRVVLKKREEVKARRIEIKGEGNTNQKTINTTAESTRTKNAAAK